MGGMGLGKFGWLAEYCKAPRPAQRSPIDPVALEEKRQRVLKATEERDFANPHLDEYRAKLVELMAAQTKSKDEFISWVTGLSTASMYLALTSLDSAPETVRILVLLSGLASFGGLIGAVAFKYFANVRFSGLQLEVS